MLSKLYLTVTGIVMPSIKLITNINIPLSPMKAKRYRQMDSQTENIEKIRLIILYCAVRGSSCRKPIPSSIIY